jgi:tetratricopeptide (TPR) repeat protein
MALANQIRNRRSSAFIGGLVLLLLCAGCGPLVIRWSGGYRGPVPREERAFQRVEAEYLRHIERNPADAAAPAQLADLYRQRGDYSRAEEYFRKSLAASPRFYFARSGLAQLYLESDRPKEAAAEAEQAAADNPGDARAFALLARARRANSDAAGERKALDDGLKLDPESVELLLEKARLELREKKSAEAERLCRLAIQNDPKNAAARADLAMVLTNELPVVSSQLPVATGNRQLTTDNCLREALASASVAVKLDKTSPAMWETLAHCRELSGDAAGSEAAWRQALKLDPDRVVARERLAGLLDRAGRTGEAEAEYRQLASRAPGQRRALERLAALCRARGEIAGELDARLRLARAFPEDPAAQRGAALALERAGESARALELWELLRKLSPGDVEAHRALARLWTRLGKAGTATFHYKAALEKNPEDTEALAGLASLAVEEKRLAEARGYYERLVKADPQNAGYRLFLGIVTAASGDNARAAEEFEAAVKLEDALPEAHRELAAVLRKLDQPERAAAEARRAVELAPRDAGAWAVLGRIEKDAGRKREAAAALARAVEESARPGSELLWNAFDAANDAGDGKAAAGFARRLLGFERERPAAARALAKLSAAANAPGEELYWLGAALAASSPADPRWRGDRKRFQALCADEPAAAAALELYRADLARDPQGFAALAGMAAIERLRGRLREAAGLYEHWLTGDPASRPAAAALSAIYAKLASIAKEEKKEKEAARLREKSLGAALRLVAIDPQSASARLVLARAYGATGDARRQEIALRAALDLDPKNAVAFSNLGVVLASSGKLAEARGAFERAGELAPTAAWPVHNLAILTGKDLADPEVAGRYRAKVDELVKAGAEPPPDANAYWEFAPEEER